MGKKKDDNYIDEDEFKLSWFFDNIYLILPALFILFLVSFLIVGIMHFQYLEELEELAIQQVGCDDTYYQDGYVYCLYEGGQYIPLKYSEKNEQFYSVGCSP